MKKKILAILNISLQFFEMLFSSINKKNLKFTIDDLHPNLNLSSFLNYDNWKSANLNGKNELVNLRTFSAVTKFGLIEKSTLISETFIKYNSLGLKTEEIKFDSGGQTIEKENFKYDNNGNKIEADYYDSKLNYVRGFSKEYNKKNKLISKSSFSNKRSLLSKTIYTYNFNNLTSWQELDHNNQSESNYKLIDDKRKREAKIYQIISEKREVLLYLLIYDKNGYIIEKNSYFDNIFYGKNKNKYNKQGKLVKMEYYSSDGSLNTRHNFVFNKKNRIIERKLEGIKNGSQRHSYIEYDQNGNVKSESLLDKDRFIISKTTYQYEAFDKNKNWTKCIMFKNNIPIEIEIRNFNYFNINN